ncbi:homoserine dehydrogenase [Candidatus Margulisiibacteriota bacterium]
MAKRVNIGIIGFGNIGSAVASALRKNHAKILEDSGVDLHIKKICDLRKVKAPAPLTRNALDIIKDPEIKIVVETIGGVKPALKFILAALNNGKHVVTPNKEVIAKHMKEIMAAARKNRVQVLFEGAVGGGIPIIQPLRTELAGNQVSEIYGIVNGTTNYILSKMTEEGMELAPALKLAQTQGYAEPDPTSDIEGYDASYKAAILASVAFGLEVKWKDVYFEGITNITLEDIQYARDIGYVIKLLAIAKRVDGKVDVRVHPALVGRTHPLASVSENFNAIYVKGKPIGELMFYGPGAGGGPTASAIIADIIQVAKGGKVRPLKLRRARLSGIDEINSRYYIRLQAPDRFGVLAGISRAFAKKKVSIAAVVQKETVGNVATIVILLDRVLEKNLKAALKIIKRLPVVRKVCNVIRIVS